MQRQKMKKKKTTRSSVDYVCVRVKQVKVDRSGGEINQTLQHRLMLLLESRITSKWLLYLATASSARQVNNNWPLRLGGSINFSLLRVGRLRMIAAVIIITT